MSVIRGKIEPDAAPDLWQIAEAGRIEQLDQVLARGADVNACNDSGVTPLMVAAYHGRREIVQALIEHGAKLDAEDINGFTAEMLADHAGHEDVVRTLVGFGVRGVPTAPTPEPRPEALPIRFAEEETEETEETPDVGPANRDPEVRTLHDPPEIWDLVHETRTEFHPRSALITHLTSVSPLKLAIALIIVSGAVFGFMKLRGGSESSPDAPSVQAESSNAETPNSSRVTVPNTTTSPVQLPINIRASTGIAGSRVDPNGTVAAPTTPAQVTPVTSFTSIAPFAPVTPSTPSPSSGKRVVAAPGKGVVAAPPPNPKSSGTTRSEIAAATVNKDTAQESKTAGPQSDSERRADPTVAKTESVKAPNPQSDAPPKASASPRGKVIQWP